MKFDFTALEDYMRHRWVSDLAGVNHGVARLLTDTDIGRRIGVSRSMVGKYRRVGLNVWQADKAAVALGVHPSAIWAGWWTAE